MKRIAFIIAPVIFALDLFTKHLVISRMNIGDVKEVVPGYFDIVFVMNRGVAFGLFADGDGWWRNLFFYGVAIVAATILALVYRRVESKAILIPVAIGLLWGGIAGNISDRFRFGAVVDFLSFHIKNVVVSTWLLGRQFNIPLSWPAFNIADSAITVAAVIFLVVSFRRSE